LPAVFAEEKESGSY